MDDKQYETEQVLRDLYYEPQTGYLSQENLYKQAKAKGLTVTRKAIREWLQEQDTYTIFKSEIKKHKFAKTRVKNLADQLQLDLVDMSKYKSKNMFKKQPCNWILTGVEVLSRFAFTEPVNRKDTKSMTAAVSELLKSFKLWFGKYPKVVQFDEGLEFYNVGVKKLLADKNINYFSTHSIRKAALVERFNRTLKSKMWKYFYANKTTTWVDVLQDLTENYNKTKHSTILMRPADVNETNSFEVWQTLYGYKYGGLPLPKFKIGDHVRISKYKNTFAKGYEANFTEEVFKITAVYRNDPVMYGLEDLLEGEKIIGKFYEHELSLVNNYKVVEKESDVDNPQGRVQKEVEKILKRKKGMIFVKWKGLTNKHNSWIKSTDLGKTTFETY